MKQGAIIMFMIGYCAFSFAQNLRFSRKFQTDKKNVPLAIINSQPDCFYVLRYNKAVHDVTIEKRAKPTAEIIGFTPLRMDSVNTSWFDYEKLDYLFFEQNRQLYFVFEKVVNTKRTVYLKIIDTLAKSSGFIELASLEQEKNIREFKFEFKASANNNILVVATQIFLNGSVKKTVLLYDIERRRMAWSRRLPIENFHTGYSVCFEAGPNNMLFYVLDKARIVSYKRKYINQAQQAVPVFFHDSINLVSYWGSEEEPQLRKIPLLANVVNLNGIYLLPVDNSIVVQAQVSLQAGDSAEANVYFFSEKLSADLGTHYYTSTAPLADGLKEALTFYDGSDFKGASDKEFLPVRQFRVPPFSYQLSERKEENYYKELLLWQTDLRTGHVLRQFIVPRKILSYSGRTRYKKVGGVMPVFYENTLHLVLLEATANFKRQPAEFKYHQFKKETNLWRANIMLYTVDKNGISKKLVYRNSEYDMVLLNYSSVNRSDVVFYLSSGKFEEFAILQLNPS